ncbi:hypothetical protein [Chromobacterium vaccinii]|uniref:hypothetical protein n=1 Tax=Chromobacterium vaccinii TaxID=1108595 RepID=UPI000E17B348|nr:hypothetical protein [Chromobacterium vaccinii]SUX30127.1 Uncharacterised protein [Chromobacterium vaccinii]
MSPKDRAQARLSATVLASCCWLCLPTAAQLLLLALSRQGLPWLPFCALAGVWQGWLNWRLRLDAGLLQELDDGTDLAQLDLALARLFGRANAAGCSMEDRQRGVAGLLRRFLAATALAWGTCLAALAWEAW